MNIVKYLIIIFMFLAVTVFSWGVPTKATAAEQKILAQAKVTKIDCKYVAEKGKDGEMIYKLIGKDCDKIVQAHQGKVCCVCRREEGVWMCRGRCCVKVPEWFR